MKKLRMLSVLLLSALLLISCGDGADKPVVPAAAAAADTAGESAAEVTEASAEYTAHPADYDGETFTVFNYDTEDYYWHAASYADVSTEEENGDPINDAQYRRNLAVEDDLNITLATYSAVTSNANDRNTYKEFQKIVMAGDAIMDIAYQFTTQLTNLLAEPDLTIDLLSLDTLDLSASWWDQNFVGEMTLYDTLHAVTGDASLYSSFSPQLVFFNKQMAEDFSLGDLYQMVRDRAWTADVMIKMCETVASDLNGDGKMDVEDRYGMGTTNTHTAYFYFASGQRYSTRDGDGSILPATNNERTVRILEKYVPFCNNADVNLLVSAFNGRYKNIYYELQIPTFQDNRLLFEFNQLLIAFELRWMDADYGLLPSPLFDEAQDGYCTEMSTSWQSCIVVPATNDCPELTGRVMDSLGYFSQQYVTPAFIDTTVRSKALRDEDSAEMLELILSSTSYDIGYFFNWGNLRSMISDLGSSNSTDFASAYAKIESKVLAAIAETEALLHG